ncbi:hypothetical protein GGS20DRAFT_445509 [Poronia punctata]|nr:hypothetical protein GGS20DRAFT_445509 [Poronia punctata]
MTMDAEESYNFRVTIGVIVSLLAVTTFSFVLRIWARFSTGAGLWWDDYWMCLVMAVCILMSTFVLLMLRYGSGQHAADLPEETITMFTKLLWGYMLIWVHGVFAVKIGILLFYWRVFKKTSSFRIGAILVGLLSAGIFLSNFLAYVFQCLPVEKFWAPAMGGSCINQDAFYLASAIINVFGDVAVLSLPLPIIWRLQTSRSRKLSVSLLFLLGVFVIVASIFRIVSVTEIDPEDFSFTNVGGGLWSTIEVEVGFICANLPALRPLIFKLLRCSTSQSETAATTNYKDLGPRIRSSCIMLQSRNRENDIEGSSSEALNAAQGILSGAGPGPYTKAMVSRDPASPTDIMVRKDFEMSVDDAAGRPSTEIGESIVHVMANNNQTRLAVVTNKFLGH